MTRTRDGARPVTHRLGQLTGWLDYAVNLGASGVALGPVFASQTHGYDTTDHYRIDPRLGDEGDFAGLVEAAHARGLRVLLDGVFNHVGRGFPAFQRVLEQGPDSPEASWFRLTWPADWQPGAEPEYGTFEGHQALVALNHDEPAVADYVAGVMNHWLDAGADGWRLDAAYAVPTAFWAQVVPRVRAGHPGAYLVGRGDPRRLPGVRDRLGPGLGHPVRAVEGHLERAERPQPVRAGPRPGPAQRVPGDVRAADLRGQPRRDPAGQPASGRPSPGPRPGRPAHRGRHARHLLRRRASLPGNQGGAGRRRRRDPAWIPGRPGRAGAHRLARLPAAPGPHRVAAPSPLAAPGADRDAASGQ